MRGWRLKGGEEKSRFVKVEGGLQGSRARVFEWVAL
jgi:hypothetical protein